MDIGEEIRSVFFNVILHMLACTCTLKKGRLNTIAVKDNKLKYSKKKNPLLFEHMCDELFCWTNQLFKHICDQLT